MKIIKTVADYYQRFLSVDDSIGMKFLKDNGITSAQALEAFQVGHATPGISKAVSPEQQTQLQEVGVVDHHGRPRFKSTLVFPLFDLEGNPVDICGINLGLNGNIKTLKDKAQGIGHPIALKGSGEVIVTDYPLEALRLYQEGCRNVVLCPDEHAASMIECEKAIVLSYRKPEVLAAAIKASEIQVGHLNGRDKTPIQALKRLKTFRKQPVIKAKFGILDRVVDDLTTLGYIGEQINKKLAYLISISRKLKRPLSGIIVSSSGAGKTGLMMAVAQLTPEEDKLLLSRLTPQALFHFPKDALVEKLIVVDERNGSSMADYSIRTMQTSNVLTIAQPKTKDEEGGVRSIKVKSAYMESTTSEDINPENASRCFVMHLDESAKATGAILEAQRRAKTRSALDSTGELVHWHHGHQRALKSLPVEIPYVEQLTFPQHRVSFRREQEKFLGLIEASALLHQHERDTTEGVVKASIEDYRIAHELYSAVFKEVQCEVSRKASALLEVMSAEGVVVFTMRQALSLTGWPYSTTHRVIKELLQYEYLKQDGQKKGRHAKTFTRLDCDAYGVQVSGLLEPEELSTNCSRTIHLLSGNCPKSMTTETSDES